MKKIALITNGIGWILGTKPNSGGSNVVATNFFNIIKNQAKVLVICSENRENFEEDNVKFIFINEPLNSQEFKTQVQELTKDYDLKIAIGIGLNYVNNGLLLESHSYQHRANSTNFLLKGIKNFLYRKRISYQKTLFENISNKDILFAVSNAIKEDYSKNLGVKNIVVSHLGCKKVFDEFNTKFNDKLTFGIVSNNSINKGGHYFVFTLGIAKLLGLKFNLKIITKKYEKDFLMKFLLKVFNLEKNTEVLPPQKDMSYFYNSIDCVVMPSINESFGLVPLEAMSYCKMALVSNTIGFTEILKENCCFIFNRKSIFDFIKTLLNIGNLFYNDKQKFTEICRNGYEISKEYSWEKFTDRILEINN